LALICQNWIILSATVHLDKCANTCCIISMLSLWFVEIKCTFNVADILLCYYVHSPQLSVQILAHFTQNNINRDLQCQLPCQPLAVFCGQSDMPQLIVDVCVA